jgi:hypothetical protein
MGGATEILAPTTPTQVAPIDTILDLVVAGLSGDAALVALVGGVDRIAAYVPWPAPETLTPAGNACFLMVCPYTSNEVPAPGVIVATIDIQVVLRFSATVAQKKAPGSPTWASVMWHVRRILSAPPMLTLMVDIPGSGTIEIANKKGGSKALPSPPAMPLRIPTGGLIYDYSQPWEYDVNLDVFTGRPRNMVLAGG